MTPQTLTPEDTIRPVPHLPGSPMTMPAQPPPRRTVLNRSGRDPLLVIVAFFVVIGLANCGYSSTSPADSANTAAAQLESGLNLSQKAIPDFKA